MSNEIDVDLPLSGYSFEVKLVISKLDTKRLFTTDGVEKVLRDWRGLAYLLNIPNELSHGISENPEKTIKVIEIWNQRNDGTNTLAKLLEYLEIMDRYDIYDDLVDLVQMGKFYPPNPLPPIGDDNFIITHDDRRDGRPNYYHAYVLFARDDWSFVRELLARMKSANFKLCTEYDIEVGYGTQYAPVAQLILERCYRIILVYSPAFLESPANSFFSNYAQAVGIESNKRNIIPIVYRPCQLPHNLMYYHKLHYSQNDEWMPYDFWLKLRQTLEKVKLPDTYPAPPPAIEAPNLSGVDINDQFLTNSQSMSRSVNNLATPQLTLPEIKPALSQSSDNIKKKKKKKGIAKMFRYISKKLNNG